jgi:hypothetical protein
LYKQWFHCCCEFVRYAPPQTGMRWGICDFIKQRYAMR